MMNNQHGPVCLGHRAENRIMIRDRRLLQGKAALVPPLVIVLSSVLLVRPALAQDFGQLSRVQEPSEPWDNPFGDSPPNIAINALREEQGAAPSARGRRVRTTSVSPSLSHSPVGSALGRPQCRNLRKNMGMPTNA